MRRAHRLAAIAAAIVLPFSLSACAGEETPSDSNVLKVGLITKFPVDFYDIMVDAVKEYDAEHDDVEVIYGQGESGTDDEGVIAIIENMIVQEVKAIAVTPTSPNVQNALDRAVAAGIKVVLIDNDIPGWNGKSSLVATDNLAGGKLAGEWLAGQIEDGAKVGILQGRLGNPSLDDRVIGFKDALGTKAVIVAEPATDCDETKGLNAAQDMLTANPEIVAIYGACGPPIIGALEAIRTSGQQPSDIVVIGFDASPDEIAAIKAGDQTASVAQFPAKMGRLGIETAVAAARGETVPPLVDTGTEIVTIDNADQFS